jgi:hypothetical protein
MKTILLTLQIEVWVFLAGLAGIIAYRLLTGAINTKGLLLDKGNHHSFSPARLQLFLTTLAIAVYYIGEVLATKRGEFPTIPREMFLVLGGSHAFYLGSKTVALINETLARQANRNL